MAGDITYADVAMLPRERPHIPSQTSVPGNMITYAELRVKTKPKRSSRSETSASGWRHRRSAWFYVALILGALVLVLLGVIAVLAKQFLKCRASRSESLSHIGVNSTGNHTSSEKTVLAVLLKWLMEELCEDGQGRTCELCPPGWQLHRSRCYYFSEEAVSWDDSQKNCLARKSQLLVIEDEIEMEFIDNKEKDTKYIWIGLKIPDMKKQWSSVEDPGVKENRKAINRIETDKNCAVYRRKNMIQVDNCQTLKKWICKKNATLLVL
ncbi:killer cell lectin-like receptor subfamily F member 1 isoform X1 [Neopsephotus bourkii]|uniref:killer cell lectin-like receptor subfamily F member 1 isoform X1 n=1 Tax=Neopsephotus bourkii TaxID=309878 RepID=UPI002AA5DB7D|nr:killer cell lectin-like receptor subfamily F member 1 isoform X1 [Neopsephotus bourkii]XP_061213659.1 killer cell lectin-like receptor subfamily F member 1 isoform X1 [Neopsephotus bourkii]